VLAWNDYLYQVLLLPHLAGQDDRGDDAGPLVRGSRRGRGNAMMAAAIIYALPPIAIFYDVLRRLRGGGP